MIVSKFRTAGFIVAACALALLASRTPARAVSEFCPATPEFQRIGDASSSLYAFAVDATGPRTVSGDIVVKADDKWYSFPFSAVPLIEIAQRWRTNEVEYTQNVFASAPFYVRFPAPVTSLSAYVSDAKTTGETLYNWDNQGEVQCSTPAGFLPTTLITTSASSRDVPTLQNPRRDMQAAPDANATIIVPALITAPGKLDCANPFTQAIVTDPVSPIYPSSAGGYGGMVLVTVLVGADGKLADAWVSTPSGRADLDEAALSAARKSKYHAGTAFCIPAPGEYHFRVLFRGP